MNEYTGLIRKRSTTSTQGIGYLLVFVVLFSALIFVRDVFNVPINKFIFLGIVGISLFLTQFKYSLLICSFILPLYVGLPGNYITLIILVRFVLEIVLNPRRFHFKPSIILLTVIFTIYSIIHNMEFETNTLYYMACACAFLIFTIILASDLSMDERRLMILFYIVGVFIVGITMTAVELRHYNITDFFNSTFRFGIQEVDNESSMITLVDPNFYGINAISVLSLAFLLFVDNDTSAKIKRYSIILAIIITVICLFGLSRSYVLCVALWAIMFFFTSQNYLKKFGRTLLILLFLLIAVSLIFPDMFNAFVGRFLEDNMEGANGRVDLMLKFYEMWIENLKTILFGVGLYDCNTHCMPLQYIFGMGVFGSTFMFTLMGSYVKTATQMRRGTFKFACLIPFICTLFMASTVPAAGTVHYTYPFIVSILAIPIVSNELSN